MNDTKHVIEITELTDERSSWECDCGAAGSAPSYNIDFAAEKHIPEGDGASYRHPAGGGRW